MKIKTETEIITFNTHHFVLTLCLLLFYHENSDKVSLPTQLSPRMTHAEYIGASVLLYFQSGWSVYATSCISHTHTHTHTHILVDLVSIRHKLKYISRLRSWVCYYTCDKN